jgi:hypothetical protein
LKGVVPASVPCWNRKQNDAEQNGTGEPKPAFFRRFLLPFPGRRRVLGFFPPLGGKKTQKENPPPGSQGKGAGKRDGATVQITVKVEGFDQVQRRLVGVQRDLRAKVLQPAINKVADKARAEINRAIPQEFNVTASEVRNAVEVRQARSGSLEAVVTVFGSASKRGRSMNLIHFLAAVQAAGQAVKVRGAKGKRSELKVLQQQLGFLIKKGGGLKKIQGAFVGNKGRTIFIREGKGRLPIKALQVIGFSQMFNTRRINKRVMDKINQELPIEVERALKLVLGRS